MLFRWASIPCEINNISDVIKEKELDVANIAFELQAKIGDKFLCFTLCRKIKIFSYLCNQISNCINPVLNFSQYI